MVQPCVHFTSAPRFHRDALSDCVALEKESSRHNLWDNPDKAQELMQEMSSVGEQIAQAESLQGMHRDIDAAAELAAVEVSKASWGY